MTGRSLRRLLQEEARPEDTSSASQAAVQSISNQDNFELTGVELGDEHASAGRTSSTETQAEEEALSASLQDSEAANGLSEPVLELSTQARGADADESLTVIGDEPATNWVAEANSSNPMVPSETAVNHEGILSSADVVDLPANESSLSAGDTSEESLTFTEVLASSQRNASSEPEDPLIQFPISGSDLPVLENGNGTAGLSLGSVNGSLQAATFESETASNVTVDTSSTSSGAIEVLDAAVNATGLSNSSSRPGNLTELLEEVSHCQVKLHFVCMRPHS